MNKPTIPPHLYREMINEIRDASKTYGLTQQLRAQIEKVVSKYIEPENGKERNKGS